MKRSERLTALFLSGLLIGSAPASAAEAVDPQIREDLRASAAGSQTALRETGGRGIAIGQGWNLGISARVSQTYDSNINRESKGREDDEIYFGIAPQFRFRRTGTEGWADLAYTPVYYPYLDEEERSHFAHVFEGDLRWERDRLKVLVRDGFRRGYERASSEQRELRDLRQNSFSPEVMYRLTDKVSVSGVYQNTLVQYLQSDLEDNSYMNHEPGGRVYYRITDKTDIFLDARAIVTDYFKSDRYDSSGFRVAGGAQGRLTDKIRLKFLAGYKTRDYDDGSLQSWDGFFAEGTAMYDWTSKTLLYLSGKRDINESLLSNNPFYEYYRAELGFEHRLFPKIGLYGSAGYQRNEYPDAYTVGSLIPNVTGQRDDDLVDAKIGLKWKPDTNWALGIDYSFAVRDSSLSDTYNYLDHIVTSWAEYSF